MHSKEYSVYEVEIKMTYYEYDVVYYIPNPEDVISMGYFDASDLNHVKRQIARKHKCHIKDITIYEAIARKNN